MGSTWDAGLYDGKHGFVWELGKGVVELLAPKTGERILDIGCGTGHLTAEIAASGASVVGIDSSTEMIEEARKKHPGIRFEVMDARALLDGPPLGDGKQETTLQGLKPTEGGSSMSDLPSQKPLRARKVRPPKETRPGKASGSGDWEASFDAVFSNAALHWIKEAERVILGVAGVLKPGGRFVMEMGGKGNVAGVMNAFERACGKLGMKSWEDLNPWYYPSVAEYAGLLEKHGLEVQQAVLFERPTPLEDGERGLRNWLEMFGGVILKQVAEEKREELLQEIERDAKAGLFREGKWVLDYRRLRVVARKN